MNGRFGGVFTPDQIISFCRKPALDVLKEEVEKGIRFVEIKDSSVTAASAAELPGLLQQHVVGVMVVQDPKHISPNFFRIVWTTLDETSRRAILNEKFAGKFGVVGFYVVQPTHDIAATLGIPFEGADPFAVSYTHLTLPTKA